jgi:drug/metabolite transporter (DMT)-like permease
MQRDHLNFGIMLAIATAVISGVSVFVNGMAVKLSDPIIYTLMKNAGVLLFLVATVIAFRNVKNFRNLSRNQWITLIAIGLIGGSIPFALFFWGLKLGGAVISSFIYRSLFIFAGIFGYLVLKEKPSKNDLMAGLLVLLGNAILLSGDISFGFGQLLVLAATVLWGLEYTLSRKILADVEPNVVMVSRMLFGSVALLAFTSANGSISLIASLSSTTVLWLGLTSILLFGFVMAWYNALKYLPVFKATTILAFGGIITTALNFVFTSASLSLIDLLSALLILIGCLIAINLDKLWGIIFVIRSNSAPAPQKQGKR